jgi:hypothetical protein
MQVKLDLLHSGRYGLLYLVFTRLRSFADAERARPKDSSRLHAQTKLMPA